MFSKHLTQPLFTLIIILFIIGVGLWYFARDGERGAVDVDREANVWNIVGEESITNNQDTATKRYTNSAYGFSFAQPEGFTAIASPYGDFGEAVVIEKDETAGFQIFIIPFDEPGPITPERIRIDLPDLVMNNIRQATLVDAPALVFDSVNEEVGETHEVWFARNGYLYQIMTYKSFENEMNAILQTWRFE